MLNVLVKRFRGANLPVRMTEGSAGYDLASNNAYIIHSGQEVYIDTDISLAIPEGYEAQVRPRSSMHKIGLTPLVSPGTIDADFRGTIKIPVRNTSMYDVSVSRGQRLAQLVFAQLPDVHLVEVEELPETERSLSGFGSTGTGTIGTGYVYSTDSSGSTAAPTEALISLMRGIPDEIEEDRMIAESIDKYVESLQNEPEQPKTELEYVSGELELDTEPGEAYVTRTSGFVKADGKKFKLSEFLMKMRDNALALPLLNDALEIIDTAGKTKYAPKNWTKSESPTPFLDAAFRHIEKHLQGEKQDLETGKSHITHALVNLLFAEALKDKS